MEAKFKMTDRVRLIDGGPVMRVAEVIGDPAAEDAPSYRCVWATGGTNEEAVYPEALLAPAPPPFRGGSRKATSFG